MMLGSKEICPQLMASDMMGLKKWQEIEEKGKTGLLILRLLS